MEQRPAPADDLNQCYAIGSKTYLKHRAKDTIDSKAIRKRYQLNHATFLSFEGYLNSACTLLASGLRREHALDGTDLDPRLA